MKVNYLSTIFHSAGARAQIVCVNALPVAISLSKPESTSIFKSLVLDLPPSMYILWISSGTCRVLRSTGQRFSATPGIPQIHPNMFTKQVYVSYVWILRKLLGYVSNLMAPIRYNLIFQGSPHFESYPSILFVSLYKNPISTTLTEPP